MPTREEALNYTKQLGLTPEGTVSMGEDMVDVLLAGEYAGSTLSVFRLPNGNIWGEL